MAHSTVRFAAGAGVIAASLLVVGPNPAHAFADKHGPGGHSYDDHRKNGSGGRGGGAGGGSSNTSVNDVVTGGIVDQPPLNLDPPQMNLGTSGSDLGDLAVTDSAAPQGQAALRSAAVAEAPTGDNAVAATPRTGSGNAGRPVTSFRAPRVVIGNGRTPGTHTSKPGSAPEAVLEQDSGTAEAAAPEAIEINVPPLPPPLPPVERIRSAELVVGEFGTGTADTVTDPLAGAAGLILLPAVGVVLGFRQARAAQSMRD